MQLQIQMQQPRRCGLQAACSERRVDEAGDTHAGFVDHAEQQRELFAAVAGGHGEQDALTFGLVRTEHRFRLCEGDVGSRARETRRARQLLGAQCAPEVGMSQQRLETHALRSRVPRARTVVIEDREARRFGQHLAGLAAIAGEQQA
jgi:hypothetical protein